MTEKIPKKEIGSAENFIELERIVHNTPSFTTSEGRVLQSDFVLRLLKNYRLGYMFPDLIIKGFEVGKINSVLGSIVLVGGKSLFEVASNLLKSESEQIKAQYPGSKNPLLLAELAHDIDILSENKAIIKDLEEAYPAEGTAIIGDVVREVKKRELKTGDNE